MNGGKPISEEYKQDVEGKVESFIQSLYELRVIVEDFTEDNLGKFHEKMYD